MYRKRFLTVALAIALLFSLCITLVGCGASAASTTGTTTTNTTTTTTAPDDNGDQDPSNDLEINLPTLALIDLLFERFSIFDVDSEKAILAAVRAYVEATGDRYALYFTESEWEQYVSENNGNLYGIGVTVIYDYEEHFIEVVNIIPDSPASKHVEIGDKITHFYENGEYVSVKDVADKYAEYYAQIYDDSEIINVNAGYDAFQYALSNVKGEAGTFAKFKVNRNGEEISLEVRRAKVTTQSVTYRKSQRDSSVGIIWINSFDLTTPVQFRAAMDTLIADGADKFVFDVRQNPGGDLASVVAVLSMILQKDQPIIYTVDSNGKETVRKASAVSYAPPENENEADYTTCNISEADLGMYNGYDMVVLTNENSASAAEVFTAALRDHNLAEIVGVKTYGKGSVQSLIELSAYGESYFGTLKLTTKLYYPPCKIGFDGGIGITPDHPVQLDDEAAKINFYKLTEDIDNQLQKAVSLLID